MKYISDNKWTLWTLIVYVSVHKFVVDWRFSLEILISIDFEFLQNYANWKSKLIEINRNNFEFYPILGKNWIRNNFEISKG